MKYLRIILVGLLATLFAGCSGLSVKDYKNEKPVLVMEEFFNGKIDGYGMLQSRSSKVKRRFHVVIDAKVENGVITLDESFDWSDGENKNEYGRFEKRLTESTKALQLTLMVKLMAKLQAMP